VVLAAVAVVPAESELVPAELEPGVLVAPGYVPADEDSPGYVPADEPLWLPPEPSQANAAPAVLSASAETIAMAAIGRLALIMLTSWLLVC
jgi:hypothetical protein